ncbi:hypothetical protein SNE25_04320 [Mucilaginibacter sabulilitoris]|uniref:Galactose oxidase n=1 Tax=Mucilaginibacter sabulilitoris TaxID=1173583 RepID=A0ABZ0TSK6_9SPHI|nr:hypothetical protein [Mucilaginibacter sabulilitoris]WPU94744.1 hypothetical protein SNE25_04320 [Mucilaginibacter sabulilitoris]
MDRYVVRIIFLLIWLCAQASGQKCLAQESYGLGFNSHEAITDQRTSLDLFPNSSFRTGKSFEMSFELSFLPNKVDYFGYIFRIIENGNRNFDLVYNNRDVADKNSRNHFKLVIGDIYSNIDFEVTPNQLFYQWNRIQLRFDYERKEVTLLVNGHSFRQPNTTFKPENTYRIIFGISKEPQFKASDCSAFKIRNVKLNTGNHIRFHWPLDEAKGTIARETVEGSDGAVANPVWMESEHAIWRSEGGLHVKGVSTATFNPIDENIYVVGKDTLWSIAGRGFVQTATGYEGQEFNLLPSNETIYNPFNHKLYNYYVDHINKKLSVFDSAAKEWQPNPAFQPAIDYWQTNSFFCKSDSSLYVVGGYGRMTYKNTVFRYDLASAGWETLKTTGYYFCPRYLAACGTTDQGNTAYLIGGYGSRTGEQMLNARNYYDLVRFDVRTRKFKKIYDLKVDGEDFVFANTMVLDESTRTFYALVFSNQKFNSELKLLHGSLDKPSYEIIGNAIPFSFHDTHSFAKLYFNKTSRQLVAVTMIRPMDHDQDSYYHFYSLLCPPRNLRPAKITGPSLDSSGILLWAGGALSLFVILIAFLRARKYLASPQKVEAGDNQPLKEAEKVQVEELPAQPILQDNRPAVYLFGSLTIINKDGEDIIGQFTSLVRELFLVILIYSLKSSRGITPEKLLELLWPDKSEDSARNNRAANLSKLRAVLHQLQGIKLSKDTLNWRLEIDHDVIRIDFWEYLQIISRRRNLNDVDIQKLIDITSRGGFIAGVDYHWLEQTKTDIANEAIDVYLANLNRIKPEEQPELTIKLANAIFVFDILNEDAMIAKCRALYALGKHSLARSTYETFNKEFKEWYGEGFKSDFNAIVSSLTSTR